LSEEVWLLAHAIESFWKSFALPCCGGIADNVSRQIIKALLEGEAVVNRNVEFCDDYGDCEVARAEEIANTALVVSWSDY
jgi:hypothetical protein